MIETNAWPEASALSTYCYGVKSGMLDANHELEAVRLLLMDIVTKIQEAAHQILGMKEKHEYEKRDVPSID